MKKKLLLTGATGFLGRYLFDNLRPEFQVETVGRSHGSEHLLDLEIGTIRIEGDFQIVLHCAGKAHSVPKTPDEAAAFFTVNTKGTELLLGELERKSLPEQFILISTVAVYGLDAGEFISEDSPLLGTTPYAKSKILAEKAVMDWCTKNKVKYVILRLPLIVGDNAPGNLGAIKNAIEKGYYFRIKGNNARKSVVLAEDIAQFIPKIIGKQGIFNLTDGIHPTFSQVEDSISRKIGKPIKWSLPLSIIKAIAKFGDALKVLHLPSPLNSDKVSKMTSTLIFDDNLARKTLGWQPRPAF